MWTLEPRHSLTHQRALMDAKPALWVDFNGKEEPIEVLALTA